MPEHDTAMEAQESLFKELFQTHFRSLTGVVYRIVGDQDLAKDVVQDAFFNLWQKKQDLDQKQSVKSYLYRTAINLAINQSKKNQVRVSDIQAAHMSVAVEQTDGMLREKELRQRIEHALQSLPPKCRAVFTMVRYESYSYRETAELLGISIKTVENQMSKALHLMRKNLSDYGIWLLLALLPLFS